jgi:uncharacterized protein
MPDNAQILQDLYGAFGRGDIPTVIAGLDEHIAWNAPDVLPHSMSVSGRDEVPAFFQKLASTWEDFKLEVEDMCASGDRVCVIGKAGGKLDGQQTSYGFVHAWTVRDGICVRFDEYVDPDELIAHAAA